MRIYGTPISAALLTAAFLLAPVTSGIPVGVAQAQSQTADEALELKGPEVSSYRLDNGLQLVVIPDRRAPVVTHMIWYKVGSADEPAGKSGIAHYLEHLMFKGTKTIAGGEFSARVAAIGGQENAFTSTDYTAYYQRVAPSALEEMMTLEADRMANLVLTDEKVAPERDVILEERRSRTENNPGSLLGEAVQAALFQNHRYGIPVIGWMHEMVKLTKDDAISFYNTYYTPNNAILVVAGDVDPEEVLALAKKTYGKVARRADPSKLSRPQEPPPTAARYVKLSNPRVRAPSFQRTYLVPSYGNQQGQESEALDILGEILGGSSTSRLYRQLIVDKKIAARAGSYYQGGARDDTRFMIYATPRQGKTLAEVETEIDAILSKLIEKGVTQEEVDRSVNRLIKSTIFARDSQTTMARVYGSSLIVGESLEKIAGWTSRLKQLKAEDITKVARKYLQMKRSVTGYLTPEKPKS